MMLNKIMFLSIICYSLNAMRGVQAKSTPTVSSITKMEFLSCIKRSDVCDFEGIRHRLSLLDLPEIKGLHKEADCRLKSYQTVKDVVADVITYRVFKDVLSKANDYLQDKIACLKISKIEAEDMNVLVFTREYFHNLESVLKSKVVSLTDDVDERYDTTKDRVYQAELNSIKFVERIGYSIDRCSILSDIMRQLDQLPESLSFRYLQKFVDEQAECALKIKSALDLAITTA